MSLARHESARHRNDFDRQGKAAQRGHQFGGIYDTHEGSGARGDDLLAGQGSAAAFDELTGRVGLIRAIDIDGQLSDFIEVHHLDTGRLQTSGGPVGTGNHRLEVAPVGGDEVNEGFDGAAGADTYHRMPFKPRKGGLRGAPLVFRCIRHGSLAAIHHQGRRGGWLPNSRASCQRDEGSRINTEREQKQKEQHGDASARAMGPSKAA